MKIIKKLRSVFIISLLLFTSFILFLFTEQSTVILSKCIKKYGSGYIEIASIEGNVARNLEFNNVLIKTSSLDIGLDKLVIDWTFMSVLIGKLPIENIKAKELAFYFKSPSEPIVETQSSTKPFVLPLPEKLIPYISIFLENLDIDGIAFIVNGNRQVEYLDRAKISADVDGNNLEIRELTIDDTAYGVSFSGNAVTGTSWWADVKGTWRFSNWDGGELLGNLTAKGPLPNMDVTVQLLAPTFVDIKGKMTKLPGNPYFDVVGKGDKASLLVVHPNCPDIRLDAFVKATGYINNYRGDLVSKGEYWKYKGMSAHGILNGDLKGLKFDNLTVVHADSQVDLPGVYLDWDEDFIVGSKVIFKNMHPQIVDDRFTGSLDGVIDGKLTVATGVHDVLGEYTLNDFSGMLRGYPVVGNLDMLFTDNSLSFKSANLSSGSSGISYKADFKDSVAMLLNVVSSDLGEILPESAGELALDVKVNGSYENPNVAGRIVASKVKFYDLLLGSVIGNIADIGNLKNGYDLDLTAKEFSFHGVESKDASLSVTGDLSLHKGIINLSNGNGSGEIKFTGNFLDGLWTSQIKDISVKHEVAGEWSLTTGSELKLSAAAMDISNTCLQNKDISSCWQATYNFDDGKYFIKTVLENYDVNLLAENSYKASGMLNGRLSLSGDKVGVKGGESFFTVSNLDLNGENLSQDFKDGELQLKAIFDGQKIATDLNVDVNDHSLTTDVSIYWDGDLSTNWKDLPLAGYVDVRGVELDFLGPMTGYDIESKGLVYGDFNLGGIVERPLLDGEIYLSSGYISLAEQGLELRDIKLKVSSGIERVYFNGEISSGSGKAVVVGNVGWQAGKNVKGKLHLSGENIEILNLPSYHILANPDIDLTFDLDKAYVSGTVFIPRADVLQESGIGVIIESDDVELVDVNTNLSKSKGYQLDSYLDVKLGDEVFIDRYGINGRLAGSFKLKDNSSNPMQGEGSLSLLDGTVDIYGRKMDISRGEMSFSGGAITNPSLDVRIQKEVRVQTEAEGIYNVGLDINGFVDKPRYTLFSSPYMDDADILSYLLLGYSMFMATGDDGTVLANAASSMGWEKGAGIISRISSILPVDQVHLESGLYDDNLSVVVGKNITSNLYVGYDYDVFDQLGEIIFRYNLYKGFYVVTKSSSEATGADFIYVWER